MSQRDKKQTQNPTGVSKLQVTDQSQARITSTDNAVCDLQRVAGSATDKGMEIQQRWQHLFGRFTVQTATELLSTCAMCMGWQMYVTSSDSNKATVQNGDAQPYPRSTVPSENQSSFHIWAALHWREKQHISCLKLFVTLHNDFELLQTLSAAERASQGPRFFWKRQIWPEVFIKRPLTPA